MALSLFAGLRVSDLAAARAWYERLLGPVTLVANDRELVWDLSETCSVYLEADPVRTGGGSVSAFVDDLDARLAEIRARGLEPTTDETYPSGVRKATFRDADGNEFGFGAAPS